MSHPLLMALFKDVSSAAAAARELQGLGLDRADLSVVARDHSDEGRIANQIDASPGSEIEDSPVMHRLGEMSGYILAAIAIGLPGTGAVVAAGPLAAEIGEAAGHVGGQVVGDLKGTLLKTGVSEEEAEKWRTVVENGEAILLGVHARNVSKAEVERILAAQSDSKVVHTTWDD
jgi:hypothetical protein